MNIIYKMRGSAILVYEFKCYLKNINSGKIIF